MLYEWDEEKNRTNLLRHGLDFADAPEIFRAPMLILLDDRMDYGEDRWIGIGTLKNRVVVVVFAEPNESTIRIISLRKALTHERKRYEDALRNELGQG